MRKKFIFWLAELLNIDIHESTPHLRITSEEREVTKINHSYSISGLSEREYFLAREEAEFQIFNHTKHFIETETDWISKKVFLTLNIVK